MWLKRIALLVVLLSIFAVGWGGSFTCVCFSDGDDVHDRPPPPP